MGLVGPPQVNNYIAQTNPNSQSFLTNLNFGTPDPFNRNSYSTRTGANRRQNQYQDYASFNFGKEQDLARSFAGLAHDQYKMS